VIYLASPYTHPDPTVRQQRFETVCQVAADMLRAGMLVFSPIAHSVPIAEHGGAPDTWDFWWGVDLEILARCDELIIVKLDGWRESRGVQAEIARARALGKRVSYVEPAAEIVEAGNVTERA